jgi:hypothetical protein
MLGEIAGRSCWRLEFRPKLFKSEGSLNFYDVGVCGKPAWPAASRRRNVSGLLSSKHGQGLP